MNAEGLSLGSNRGLSGIDIELARVCLANQHRLPYCPDAPRIRVKVLTSCWGSLGSEPRSVTKWIRIGL